MDVEIFAGLLMSVAAGIGGYFAGRADRPVPPAITKALPFLAGHEHDWRISGKVGGRIARYCLHCDATKLGN
jgi:hypothetical protein